MNIRGIIFDVNGTLIDIHTDEGYEEIYRAISYFFTYQEIYLDAREVRDGYYRIMGRQRKTSAEQHPEFDAVEVWREFIDEYSGGARLLPGKPDQMPRFLAQMYRAISRHRLQLYPDVKTVLDELLSRFSLAVVSDAQSVWARAEMRALGIESYFNPIIISGDFGFKKPDRRLFEAALSAPDLSPENVLFVGNDMYRDMFGAQELGMKTVFFSSNQGRKEMNGVNPDYIIYEFGQLRDAISFFQGR